MKYLILRTAFLGALLSITSACGGGHDPKSANDPAGGTGGASTGGTGGAAGQSASGMPVPPGPGDVPRPSGTSANLRVLPWAGFSAGVSYTFDDSQPSQLEHWQELKATGIRMTFYINSVSNWAAGYDDTWRDALAQGHEIANHTVHHCRPSELTDADTSTCSNGLATVEEEIDQCTAYIASPIGQPVVWTFAYPFGDLGYKAAASTRFFLARGVQQGTIAPTDARDPFNLPIIGYAGDPTVPGGDPVTLFNMDIDTAVAQGRWIIYLLHSILPTTNNWFAGEDIAAITGSIEHAKGLGNVWLDSVVNIGAYWLGQRVVQAAVPATDDGKTTWTWTLPEHFPPGHFLRVAVDGGTLSQGQPLTWDGHGYYEVALDAGTLEWNP